MTVGVQRGVPMTPRLVDVDRVRLAAQLAQQAVAQQAVLAAAREHGDTRRIDRPSRDDAAARIGRKVHARQQVVVAALGLEPRGGAAQERVGLEKLLDEDLASRVARHLFEETPVGRVVQSFETDLATEETVVQRDLRRDHRRQVERGVVVVLEHVFFEAVDQFEAVRAAVAHDTVRGGQTLAAEDRPPDFETVEDEQRLERRSAAGAALGAIPGHRRFSVPRVAAAALRRAPRRRRAAGRRRRGRSRA